MLDHNSEKRRFTKESLSVSRKFHDFHTIELKISNPGKLPARLMNEDGISNSRNHPAL